MNDTTDTPERDFSKRKPYFNIYKPLKKANAGAALQFSYDSYKRAIFLEAAQQKGEKLEIGSKEQFDWKNKIVFKIGTTDISRLFLVFSGREKEAKCLHSQQGTGRTTVLEFIQGEYQGKPNFSLKLSRTKDGETQRTSMFISQEEVSILAHFVRESLTRMLGFSVSADVSRIERQLDALIEVVERLDNKEE